MAEAAGKNGRSVDERLKSEDRLAMKVIGYSILVAIFLSLFFVCTYEFGIVLTISAFGISIILSAAIVFAINLIVNDD